jgi:hypothetical protein
MAANVASTISAGRNELGSPSPKKVCSSISITSPGFITLAAWLMQSAIGAALLDEQSTATAASGAMPIAPRPLCVAMTSPSTFVP